MYEEKSTTATEGIVQHDLNSNCTLLGDTVL